MKERIIQLITAAVLARGGLVLLFYGASVDPEGQIDDSLLVAFGEVATFAGAIIGIDYSYKARIYDNHHPKTNPPNGKSHPRLNGAANRAESQRTVDNG